MTLVVPQKLPNELGFSPCKVVNGGEKSAGVQERV
jgi:hypothetical protein